MWFILGLRRVVQFVTKVYRGQDYNSLVWCFGDYLIAYEHINRRRPERKVRRFLWSVWGTWLLIKSTLDSRPKTVLPKDDKW